MACTLFDVHNAVCDELAQACATHRIISSACCLLSTHLAPLRLHHPYHFSAALCLRDMQALPGALPCCGTMLHGYSSLKSKIGKRCVMPVECYMPNIPIYSHAYIEAQSHPRNQPQRKM